MTKPPTPSPSGPFLPRLGEDFWERTLHPSPESIDDSDNDAQ